MDKRERLAELVNYYADGSQVAFCRKTGLGKSGLSRMLSGQMQITDKQIIKIASAIPDAKAFLEGQSDLPKRKTVMEQLAEKDAEIERLNNEIAIKNRVINALLSKGGF